MPHEGQKCRFGSRENRAFADHDLSSRQDARRPNPATETTCVVAQGDCSRISGKALKKGRIV
jgi:hypothetical protein